LDTETAIAADSVGRVRSRIVQSPERKRRNIFTMRDSAAEDKKTHITLLERQRELRVKVAALKNIAKVLQCLFLFREYFLTCKRAFAFCHRM
jgi:kinetochore protein Nuf2